MTVKSKVSKVASKVANKVKDVANTVKNIEKKKLPTIWNPNAKLKSYWWEAFKKWFANQGKSWPVKWIVGTALWTMVWLWADAVNVPYQWLKWLYNTAAALHNARASKLRAKEQAKKTEKILNSSKNRYMVKKK